MSKRKSGNSRRLESFSLFSSFVTTSRFHAVLMAISVLCVCVIFCFCLGLHPYFSLLQEQEEVQEKAKRLEEALSHAEDEVSNAC